jgi:hypothetical protein
MVRRFLGRLLKSRKMENYRTYNVYYDGVLIFTEIGASTYHVIDRVYSRLHDRFPTTMWQRKNLKAIRKR